MRNRFQMKLKTVSLFLVGLFFSALFMVTLKIHYDNTQILTKAYKLLDEGVWTHHGNAATAVGFVPGTFLTFITAGPMMIYDSPYAAMAVIVLFHVVSLFFLLKTANSVGRDLTLLLLLVYWLNPWRVEQSELYNPAYLFFFAGAHLWSSMKMRRAHFGWTLFHTVVLGLCAQLHFSALILIFLTAALVYRREIQIHWGAFALGSSLILLSLIPFAREAMASSPERGLTPSGGVFWGKNLLLVFPVLKSVLYWVRYGSTDFGRHIFSELEFSWIRNEGLRSMVETSFTVVRLAFAGATLVLSAVLNYRFFKRWLPRLSWRRPESPPVETTARHRFERYFVLLFLSMVAAAALSPVEFNHWHLIICFPAVALFIALNLQIRSRRLPPRAVDAALAAVFVYFAAHDTFAAFGSRSHSLSANYERDAKIYYDRPSATKTGRFL